jgi:CHAD domain-containing protein
MEAKTVLLEALKTRWGKFRAELKSCRKDFSEEAVHDLRVATRRLLAYFDLLWVISPHKRIQKIRRALKDQLDELDDLRDVQVMLVDIIEAMQELPDLKPFHTHLRKEEKQQLRLVRKVVKARDIKGLSQRVKKVFEMVQGLPDANLDQLILSAVDEAYARVLQTYSTVDIEHIATIHRLRIAFKRFRYSVEIVHDQLAHFPKTNFERMHEYQSKMGDVQDLEVASQHLADLDTSASLPGFELVTAHYASRLKVAILNFNENKGEVLVFWRTSSDQSFPWEKSP